MALNILSGAADSIIDRKWRTKVSDLVSFEAFYVGILLVLRNVNRLWQYPIQPHCARFASINERSSATDPRYQKGTLQVCIEAPDMVSPIDVDDELSLIHI